MTTGGTIVLPYNNRKYYVDIVETKPTAAVCIIETDCEVDFAPPLDYKEPEKRQGFFPLNDLCFIFHLLSPSFEQKNSTKFFLKKKKNRKS